MKSTAKKSAYDHNSIRELYDDEDWIDEDQLRNKRKQKNKAKKKRQTLKEDYLNE